jgi:murein DD-endopeptidase MepM/ murein hydrolase activator NlpD
VLSITGADGQFTSALTERPTDVKTASRGAVIQESLYHSARNAGVPDRVILQLAEIFGWDIDFSHEIRAGDRFNVLYETRHIDGEEIGTGPILAASFVNRGKEYHAIRFTDPSGRTDYYTPDGRTMRKAFLRSPVDFRRISSRFQKERYHPVLGVKRPHRGVDFAAAIGTPIKAAGDGKVIFRGWKSGYGNTVILSHGNGYTTLYGHMSRFRKDVKAGSRVKQGQLIGYVGKTGLATGPHLHYEFRINGAHRNPLTVDLPDAAPIDPRYRAQFEQSIQPLLAQLQSADIKALASAEQDDGAL